MHCDGITYISNRIIIAATNRNTPESRGKSFNERATAEWAQKNIVLCHGQLRLCNKGPSVCHPAEGVYRCSITRKIQTWNQDVWVKQIVYLSHRSSWPCESDVQRPTARIRTYVYWCCNPYQDSFLLPTLMIPAYLHPHQRGIARSPSSYCGPSICPQKWSPSRASLNLDVRSFLFLRPAVGSITQFVPS